MPAAPLGARFRRRLWLAPTLLVVIALAACQSSASGSPSEAPASGGADADIVLDGSAFHPETLTVAAGEAVSILNDDGRQHRIVEGEEGTEVDDPAFEALSLDGGASGEITFDEPGTYNLTCTIHSSMQMVVTVE
jgi:plastocyanin